MAKFKCMVCGYIHTGDNPPENCPNCKSPKEKFVEMPDSSENKQLSYTEKVTLSGKVEINPFFEDYISLAPFIYNLPVGKKAPLHKHPLNDEMFFMIKGKAKFRIGDEYFILKEGDMIQAKMNTQHDFENISSEPVIFLSVKGPKPVKTEILE